MNQGRMKEDTGVSNRIEHTPKTIFQKFACDTETGSLYCKTGSLYWFWVAREVSLLNLKVDLKISDSF